MTWQLQETRTLQVKFSSILPTDGYKLSLFGRGPIALHGLVHFLNTIGPSLTKVIYAYFDRISYILYIIIHPYIYIYSVNIHHIYPIQISKISWPRLAADAIRRLRGAVGHREDAVSLSDGRVPGALGKNGEIQREKMEKTGSKNGNTMEKSWRNHEDIGCLWIFVVKRLNLDFCQKMWNFTQWQWRKSHRLQRCCSKNRHIEAMKVSF